ncbi:MAG: Ig-like domain-containing protein, partial [Rikenellaceae bacterium]|nr:Ig-like domain-containing protein [Rikenellaceae bacterium]
MKTFIRNNVMLLLSVMVLLAACGKGDEPDPGPGPISDVKVSKVSLNKTTLSLVVGGGETLAASITPANATNRSVTWSSNPAAVATVDASGKVTAVKAGTATITVTTDDGGHTATCSVTVTAGAVAVTGVALAKTEETIAAEDQITLTVTITPSNATNRDVTWSSSVPAVATVDAKGK